MAPVPHASDASLIELFLDMLAAERGAGANTLAAYGRDLADFSAHLADASARATIANAKTEDCAAICRRSRERGFAAASVARRLSAIRQLYRFLYAEGRRGDDPAAIIEGPKRGRALPKCSASPRSTACWRQRARAASASDRCRNGCAPRG